MNKQALDKIEKALEEIIWCYAWFALGVFVTTLWII